MRYPVAVALVGAVLAGAGCTQQAPTGEGRQPRADVLTPSPATDSTPLAVTTSPPANRQAVEVHVRYDVPPDDASRTLVAFVRAHAKSVIAGRATPELARLTTQPEHRRQVAAVRFAVRRGYTVPTDPRVAVVSRQRTDFGQVLGVCVWLPSTEFMDTITGQRPHGPVPREWVPAVATLRKQTVTWKVDKLSAPANPGSMTCGGTA